jgi:FkbM family methyltransferase
MTLKAGIKRLLQSFGYDLVRYVAPFERPFDVLGLLIQEVLQDHPEFFFVQVGANDGILDDPLRASILKHKLSGLLIEPIPEYFTRLKAHYCDQTQLLFENCALAPKAGELELFRVKASAKNLPSSSQGIASFQKSHLLQHQIPSEAIESLRVPCKTLSSLLQKHQISAIHLLQIDTEGYDAVLLQATFMENLFPAIIQYEHCHLWPKDRLACKKLLDQHGYRFIEISKDTLAYKIP